MIHSLFERGEKTTQCAYFSRRKRAVELKLKAMFLIFLMCLVFLTFQQGWGGVIAVGNSYQAKQIFAKNDSQYIKVLFGKVSMPYIQTNLRTVH